MGDCEIWKTLQNEQLHFQTSWMFSTQHLQKKFPVRTIFLFCFVPLPWSKIPNLPYAKHVLHNLPKEKDAALPFLTQALEYSSLTCLQETTYQFLPLPGVPAPLPVWSQVSYVTIPELEPRHRFPNFCPTHTLAQDLDFVAPEANWEKKKKVAAAVRKNTFVAY